MNRDTFGKKGINRACAEASAGRDTQQKTKKTDTQAEDLSEPGRSAATKTLLENRVLNLQ